MTKLVRNQIDKFEYREKNLIRILFSVFVFLFISYGFLVNGTIMNAINKQHLEKEISALNSSIGSMEFDYLNLKNSITMDLALQKGFVLVEGQKFASIKSDSNNLSLSINEN